MAEGRALAAGTVAGAVPVAEEGGALNIDCCSSVVAILLPGMVGMRYVPSNFAIVSDFPLAYWIFYADIVT